MKQIHVFLFIALLWATITPSYAALPEIEYINKLKKSLATHADHFIKCVKGHKECSPQEKIIVKTTISLLIALGLVIVGKGAYVLKKYMELRSLQEQSDVNKQLLTAAKDGDLPRVKELILIHKANVNSKTPNEITPLLLAIDNNNLDMAEFLLQQGADTNYYREWYGSTLPPLHEATKKTNLAMIQLLLKYGADVNFQNETDTTPLSIAISKDSNKAVLFLLKNNANVNLADSHGGTPLHQAAIHGNVDIARILIGHGANINAQAIDEETPLFDAAATNKIDMVQFLLDHGADPTIPDANGTLPADITSDLAIKNILQHTQRRDPIYKYKK